MNPPTEIEGLDDPPDFKIVAEDGGFAVIHVADEGGGLGAIRFAATMEEAVKIREEMRKSMGEHA